MRIRQVDLNAAVGRDALSIQTPQPIATQHSVMTALAANTTAVLNNTAVGASALVVNTPGIEPVWYFFRANTAR